MQRLMPLILHYGVNMAPANNGILVALVTAPKPLFAAKIR